jgi:hypothetical protein
MEQRLRNTIYLYVGYWYLDMGLDMGLTGRFSLIEFGGGVVPEQTSFYNGIFPNLEFLEWHEFN